MKYTMRHYYAFGRKVNLVGNDLLSPLAWDQVRMTDEIEAGTPAFHLPKDRDDWLRTCHESSSAAACAADIAQMVRRGQFTKVLSVGVGRACLEYHLKCLEPAVHLVCTEYSPRVVERLQQVFLECDRIELLDIKSAGWMDAGAHCLVLLNRVDTELDDQEWRVVFKNLAGSGVKNVLIVATGFLTLRTLAFELSQRLMSMFFRRGLTFAGYTRTKARFKELWSPSFTVVEERSIGTLVGFYLAKV
jgi:hypothetical protein